MQVATAATWPKICGRLPRVAQKWADAQNFTGAAGTCLQIPDGKGAIAEVILGSNPGDDGFQSGSPVPAIAAWYLCFQGQQNLSPPDLPNWPGAWKPMGLTATRRKPKNSPASYALPMLIMKTLCGLQTPPILVRDLINTPSNDFGPDELEAAARKVASHYKAKLES